MECGFKYLDVAKNSSKRSALKVLQSMRNTLPDVEEKESRDANKRMPISPSEYIKQISLNPESLLCKNVDNDKCTFTANPRVIVFKKFDIGNIYSITLSIRNTSQVPYHIRLLNPESVFFNVTFKGSTLVTRLAPGMTHTYDVEFRPTEMRDYFHDIVFKTDVEPFKVQAIAVGPRALLSFPDQIDMGQTAVKVAKLKPILLQNIGEVFTAFSIFTDNPCFVITPSKASTEPGKAIQMTVKFTPTNLKTSSGNIFLRYESGDIVQSIIYGEAVLCDVRIHNEVITIDNTYLGLSRLTSIEIENNSDYPLHYEWVQYKSINDDLEEKEKCKKIIEERIYVPVNNTIVPGIQKSIQERIHSDEIELLKNKSLTYDNDHYRIFPTDGEVWPHNKTEVSVTFQPQKVGTISSIAYLEIGGQENRIPVSLLGKCRGPALELNLLSLNIQEVYLYATYNYEIVCKNVGPILGTLVYMDKNANFGSTIEVEPHEIEVNLDELKTMKLSFSSNRMGHFVERIDFLVKESLEVLSFVMKGTVICPLTRTDKDEINFHRASLCFTMKKQLNFLNHSHAPLEFNIRVLSDGYEMPITHEEFARSQTKPKFPSCPREFFLFPSDGTIEPHNNLQVQLSYTPNIVRSGDTQIQINMRKNSSIEPILLPMRFRAKRAILNVTPNEISIPFCFVNCPYHLNLTISNSTKIEGYFYFIPQEIDDDTTILYSLSTYQGYLKPEQSKEISLTIIVKKIGPQHQSLRLLSLGLENPVICCEIICEGQGPIVSTKMSHLNWGEIQLLQTKSLTLELMNDSPISAEFTTSLKKTKNIWEIEPSTGELDPNVTTSLIVSIKLRDTGKFSDRLLITIFNGKSISVNLTAIGVGTCIIFEPEIFPKFDIGFLFSHQDINISITIINEGTKQHTIYLTNIEKSRQTKASLAEETESCKFKIEPNTLELLPGTNDVLNFKIRSNSIATITEKWYFYATVEGQGKREFVGSSEFIATFIEPNVIFNKNELIFILDLGWTDTMLQQMEKVEIENQSGRDLNTRLTIDSPFVIIDKCNCYTNDIDMVLINNKSISLQVYFPFDVENSELLPQKYTGYLTLEYKEHKNTDKILCKAEVNFPHVSLESNEVNLYCATGYSVEEKVKFINDTPLPVFYNIKWIKETFVYEKLSLISEGNSEGSIINSDYQIDKSMSITSLKNKNKSYSRDKLASVEEILSPTASNIWSIMDYYENVENLSKESSSVLNEDTIHPLDKFLQIAENIGQIFPYNEQTVSFIFNGFEKARISVQAVCEIARGSCQILYINAISDTVRCNVPQEDVLKFDLQLFCEPAVTTFKLTNQCLIPLLWTIDMSSNLLQVIESPHVLEPNAESPVSIERQPSAPGKFSEKLYIKIAYLETFTIDVEWYSTIPQLYMDIPRDNAFLKYPISLGYRAVQLVIAEAITQNQFFTTDLKCSSNTSNTEISESISESKIAQLNDNNWHIVTRDDDYPSQTDIDMAFERLIVKNYIEINEDAFVIFNSNLDTKELPLLLAPAYLINMNFVLVEQTAHFSICLKTYGFNKANVKLIKEKKKNKSSKIFFFASLEKHIDICQCESTTLNVIFSPKKSVFSEERTDVTYKFYLQVKQGLTIPVNVQASAVYPHICTNIQTLNFNKVFTGQCKEMAFLLKNNGFIDCHWEISIENQSKNVTKCKEHPFEINYNNDVFSPNKESIIKVYFRPYRSGIHRANLLIMVSNAQDIKKIRLKGYGVERKVNINKTIIKFPFVIPNTKILEEYLVITNDNEYPVELYWQHIDDFRETNKVIRALQRYYRIDEILIPQRDIGENLPQLLTDFYNKLINDMYLDDEFHEIIKNIIKDTVHDDYLQNEFFNGSKDKVEKITKKKESVCSRKKKINKKKIEKPNSLGPSILSNIEPNTVETLLNAYIDKLQRNSKFCEIMEDPLSQLYKIHHQRIVSNYSEQTVGFEKKLVIIFHGAPFTEYQETACRCAKVLNLPLLNLNQLLIEIAAFAEDKNAKDFAKKIDKRYQEVIAKITNTLTKKSLASVTSKLQQFWKQFPTPEELERMDPYSLYEYKFEIIAQGLNNFESLDSSGVYKAKDKENAKNKGIANKKQNILPDVSEQFIQDILQERLSKSKFKYGYVLQTLNNDVMKNESSALRILLEATGSVRIHWIITFYNSLELYETRIKKLNRIKAEEEKNRINNLIKSFHKITLSEIELLSEEDKILYYHYRDKNSELHGETLDVAQTEVEMKKKSEVVAGENESASALSREDFKKTKQESDINFQDVDKVSNIMNDYINNLNQLFETINKWEKKSLLRDNVFIWQVLSEDPWERKMYDATVSQVTLMFEAFPNYNSSENKMQSAMQTQTYSMLKEYEMSTAMQTDIFTLLPQKSEKIAAAATETNESMFSNKKDNEHSPTAIDILDGRCLLQPHESYEFRIEFSPTEEGSFESEFLLTLVDNAISTFKISATGSAEIPKLDLSPYSVFDRVQNSKVSESHKPTYFLNSQVYNFGSIIFTCSNDRMYKKQARFNFKNISSVSTVVDFSLLREQYDYFHINPRQLKIQASEIGTIDVTARALRFDTITDTLMLSINNNDKPEIIQLECNGIELNVELEPKQLNLNRILLNTIEKRIMIIRNNSPIVVYWCISTNTTESTIQLVPKEGKLKYKGCCEIELQYYANIVGKADTKYLTYQLFLNECKADPIATDNITITAETYDIEFQLSSDIIDFNKMTVGSTDNKSVVIKNLGPYEVEYKIQYQEFDVLKKFCDPSVIAILKDDFKIQSTAGLISKHPQTINIIYTPSVEITLKSVPLFKCAIIEPYKNIGTVKENIINISVISYYTRFSIEPHPILNFGTIALKSTKAMRLKVSNTGKFPLKYSIVNQSTTKHKTDPNTNKSDKTKSKCMKKSSKQVAKINTTHKSKWEPFYLDRVAGELDPGQVDMLTIHCSSNSFGHFDEKLIFIVPESLAADEENRRVSLVANVCPPDIDFKNFNEIFIESHVVDSYNQFICPSESGEHSIFEKTAKCLHFCRVCIGSNYTIYLTLTNISFINGDVIIELLKSDLNAEAFKINTNRLSIPAMSKENFTITFAPTLLGKFSSLLKIKLDLPEDVQLQTFCIDLKGESCMPQICILEPSLKSNEKLVIDFGLSFILEKRQKICRIQNIGQVKDNLIVKLMDNNTNNVFGIFIEPDKDDLSNNLIDDKDIVRCLNIPIIPGEIINVRVQLLPKKAKKYINRLTIIMERNPYETFEIDLLGNGFSKDVIFEYLDIIDTSLLDADEKQSSQQCKRKSRRSSINKQEANEALNSTPLVYKLDYEKCFLNEMNKINFKIVNKTSDRKFRFELNSHPNIVFTPSAGHLAPSIFKEITATFLASEPIILSQMPIDCIVNEIELSESEIQSNWDTRQMTVSWEEKFISSSESKFCENDKILKKVITESQEPAFKIVSETVQQLQLWIYAIADYSYYSCDTKSIDFDDTLMFQSQNHKIILENTGKVNLNYSWDIVMDEQYPIRLDNSKLKLISNCESSITVKEQSIQSYTEINESMYEKLIIVEDLQLSFESSDLFSNSADLTNRTTDTWIEGDNWPFRIKPETGSIDPEKSVHFTMNFSPIDVFQYKAYLQCKMENLNPTTQSLNIVINATSLLPYCHFEIQESDYLTSGRRDDKLPFPSGYSLADSGTINKMKIVEFDIMGTGEYYTRHIRLVNPTTEEFSYSFVRLSNTIFEKLLALQCFSEMDVIASGSRKEISFCMMPEEVGLFESFWQFEIKKYNLSILILIVINVTEPLISYKNTLVKLATCTVGELTCSSFELINNEVCPLKFNIKADSLYTEGRYQSIVVYPLSGILKPNSTKIFSIEYMPSLIGKHIFNVQCQIEKLRKLIQVPIMAHVIELSPMLIYIDIDDQDRTLFTNCDNIIDIGQIILNKEMKLKFKLMNNGQIAFDYSWILSSICENTIKISISEKESRIEENSSKMCYLKLLATEKLSIRYYSFSLQIKYGPTYHLKLHISGKKIPIEFSFSHYNFGPSYIQLHNGIKYSVDLKVTNHQNICCPLQCTYNDNSDFKVNLQQLSQAIPPNATIVIPIYFQPIEEKMYDEVLHFSTLNESIQTNVLIRGQGVMHRICLKNPADAIINFGTITIGKTLSRKICVANEGCVPVKLKIDIIDYSSANRQETNSQNKLSSEFLNLSKDFCSPESDVTSHTTKSFDIHELIEFSPKEWQNLKQNTEMEITIKFKGVHRVKSLRVSLGFKIDSFTLPLTIVKGNCTMASFYINRTYISFGTIFEGCTAKEKLMLINNGDLGSKFIWKKEKNSSYFDIIPSSGYCSANSKVVFTCTFKVNCQVSCTQSQFTLALENHENFFVNVTGNCAPIPEPTEIMNFLAEIHQSEIKEITIYNDSDRTWYLKPKIIGEYFTTVLELSIDPKTEQPCTIAYKPKKLTSDSCFDKGKLIIINPDGKEPILYNLRGRCISTGCVKQIFREITVKQKFVEPLIVYNDSEKYQTFACRIEPINIVDNTVFPEFQVDVPAKKQIYFDCPFYFEREGHFNYKITFNDYQANSQCYNVEFVVSGPKIQDYIELTTYARNVIFHTLRIDNPLENSEVIFDANNIIEDITIHGLPTTLDPLSSKNIKIEYLPLIPREQKIMLEITSEALGSIFYELHLIVKRPLPEKPIKIKSSLGKSIDFTLQLKNYSKNACDFDITVDEPSFTCPKTVSIRANEEAAIDVRFEPSIIGNTNATIKAMSSATGEFIFPVIGQSTLPQPQGPFVVTTREPISINFKNVFLQTTVFYFSLDNQNFTINCNNESLDPKQCCDIIVTLKDDVIQTAKTKVGKLIVTCKDGQSQKIEWMYYLRGVACLLE